MKCSALVFIWRLLSTHHPLKQCCRPTTPSMTVASPSRTMCPRKRAPASEFPRYHSDLASMRHAWPCPNHGGRTSRWVTAMPDLLLGPPWIKYVLRKDAWSDWDRLSSLSCPPLLSLPLPSGSVVHMTKWHPHESQDPRFPIGELHRIRMISVIHFTWDAQTRMKILTSRWRGMNSSLSSVSTSPSSSSISSPPFLTSTKSSTLFTEGDLVSPPFPEYLPSFLPKIGILLPDGELSSFPSILLSSFSTTLAVWPPGESNGSLPSRESSDWMDSVREDACKERQDPASEDGLELMDGTLCQWRGMLRDLSRDNGEKGWKGRWRGTPQTDS